MVGRHHPGDVGSRHEARPDAEDSPLRRQLPDALRRARKLPIGHERNDLRQLAMGLLWLERKGLQPMIQDRLDAALTTKDFRE